jgi:hypothetical protein
MSALSRSSGLNLEREQADLAKAERDIVEGQIRITEQELRIEQLRLDGHDTKQAEELLALLRGTLAEWVAHREQILKTIDRLRPL